jgi:hypothetical protein
MIEKIRLARAFLFVTLILGACFVVSSAQATTVVVGTCKSGLTQFSTIQGAVNAAPAGSTIDICPGTYPEQVTINGKKLTLIGIEVGTSNAAVIVAPAGGVTPNTSDLFSGFPIAAQIFVENAVDVTISHLTIDGSANGLSGCGTDLQGIYYANSSGTITDNVVRNQILDPGDQGCQDGLAINIASNSGTPAVTISNNSVRNYDKNGITANGIASGQAGPNVTITDNTVIGIGATNAIAQNGIQVGFGATAKITGNEVADNIYTGAGTFSTGILIYASTGVTVSSNTIESAQEAIVTNTDPTSGPADSASITANHIGGSQQNFDAIDLCSNSNIAESNVIYGSAQSGVHADDGCPGPGSTPSGNNNTIEKNTVNEACAGILEGSGTGNVVSPNTLLNVTNTTLAGDSCPVVVVESSGNAAGAPAPVQHHSLRPSPYGLNRK